MSLTPQDFVAKWKRVTAREKQTYQEHFIDLCHLAGHQTPNDFDPTGTRFGFEMGAAKTSGGQGWADVAKLGYFGWEYKGKDADLDKAYEQLLRYRDALQNPPLLVVSDINQIVIRTNYTNLPTRTIKLTLDDLLKPESIKLLKLVFSDPEQLKPQETVESVTREAAEHFSKLADNFRKYGNDPQEIAHFLIRLLFCLFAEDIGLLPEKLFPQLLEQTRRNSKDFAEVLRQLFRAMNTGGFFGRDKILHFNGGLFNDDYVLSMDSSDMDIIAAIDALDWAAIEPSIFGTLFERGLDPGKRSQLGAHYTSKDDILLIVEPVLMAPLRREWQAVQAKARELASEKEKLQKTEYGPAAEKQLERERAKYNGQIISVLQGFANQLASIKVLDPACGSGNFLYVALALLLDLQNEVINLCDALGAGRFFISVEPEQVFGIETNEYAHELAQITVWIGYLQWRANNGYGWKEPILRNIDNILHMDALLADNENGQPLEPEWPVVDVIIGNPPFLGGKRLRSELGDEYVDQIFKLYDGRVPREADLVCYWFEKARAMIESGQAKRAGLLATQGIRGGANRKILERIKETGNIFWAQSDRDWVLNGATVHVSMIGFDNSGQPEHILDGNPVSEINADLTSNVDLTKAKRLEENTSIAFMGITPAGPFAISDTVANAWMKLQNPNGRSNSDVLRPYFNGQDMVSNYRKMWIIDYGVGTRMDVASLYEAPFEYIVKNVKPARMQQRSTIQEWWLHERSRPDMRLALLDLPRYIATPRVSKHRIFVWIPGLALVDSAAFVFARSNDYFFGVLHSKIHELWARATGTQLREAESGFRYTPRTTFETFPFPWPPGLEPLDDPRVLAIASAAKELVEMRDRWLAAGQTSEVSPLFGASEVSGARGSGSKRTLTNLYNARPTWLDLAHQKLDAAVLSAYGWPEGLSDDEILERFLKLNLERAG
jgi:type II restriction/modification system DNA methylase subunit YeeA